MDLSNRRGLRGVGENRTQREATPRSSNDAGVDGGALTLAISAKWHTYPERFSWAEAQGLALEYTPGPEALHLLREHTSGPLQAGIPVRYHAYFPEYELAHRDPFHSEAALQKHLSLLDAIRGPGEKVVTVHVCYPYRDRADVSDSGRLVKNLSCLVSRARELDITIALENFARGPASLPERIAMWACESGAMITLDIGHALSCQSVQQGDLSVVGFVDIFADRLVEAHVYGKETDRHYPITDIADVGPILDRLLQTSCAWWTIELDEEGEVLSTRALLMEYLGSRRISIL